ncbi:RnfH family protein [Halochromatium roseum]|nr:RnfH family protein [Halochromatium roseum]MBK5939184.1 RnfH family protein [Halochromatium roseum]
MVTEQSVNVEVAYARERAQALIPVKGQQGITLAEAIERSGILERFPEIDLDVNKVGIFGKVAKLDQVLASGDRVEIYPPLIADPKQARKQRATGAKAEDGKAAAEESKASAANA